MDLGPESDAGRHGTQEGHVRVHPTEGTERRGMAWHDTARLPLRAGSLLEASSRDITSLRLLTPTKGAHHYHHHNHWFGPTHSQQPIASLSWQTPIVPLGRVSATLLVTARPSTSPNSNSNSSNYPASSFRSRSCSSVAYGYIQHQLTPFSWHIMLRSLHPSRCSTSPPLHAKVNVLGLCPLLT
jgi:hypothetical protein